MEGTHTVLVLYAPIHELCNISLYFPKRWTPGFKYKSRASISEEAGNDREQEKEDVSRQRVQSSACSGRLLYSRQATKEAVAELSWLAAEHHQLLVDLLSLCRDCASKVRMGNQDGKVQDYVEGQRFQPASHHVSSSSSRGTPASSDHKKATSKSRKMKKLGGKKLDSAEDLLHSKMKKQITSAPLGSACPPQNAVPAPAVSVAERAAVPPAVVEVCDSPATGSYVSAVSNPILPMEEPFQMSREAWDFMEDNRTFDPDMYFCNDFSEYDSELGFESSSCSLIEGLSRRNSGSNLRPIRRFDSPLDTLSEGASSIRSSDQSCNDDLKNTGVRVVAKLQDVAGKVQHVGQNSPDGQDQLLGVGREKTANRQCEGLWLPLSNTNSLSCSTKPHLRSPTSSSLSGVFNTSYPTSNSLQSMSPVLSPLPSKQGSPQLNHRIVLLCDKDVDSDPQGNIDEPKIYTEIIDRNGNKRTITRLDLNLSRRPSNAKWNSSSNSTTTGEF